MQKMSKRDAAVGCHIDIFVFIGLLEFKEDGF